MIVYTYTLYKHNSSTIVQGVCVCVCVCACEREARNTKSIKSKNRRVWITCMHAHTRLRKVLIQDPVNMSHIFSSPSCPVGSHVRIYIPLYIRCMCMVTKFGVICIYKQTDRHRNIRTHMHARTHAHTHTSHDTIQTVADLQSTEYEHCVGVAQPQTLLPRDPRSTPTG